MPTKISLLEQSTHCDNTVFAGIKSRPTSIAFGAFVITYNYLHTTFGNNSYLNSIKALVLI